MGAEVTLDRDQPQRLRIVLREGGIDLLWFVAVVMAIVLALYLLSPDARAHPALLVGLSLAAVVWTLAARRAHEILTIDRAERTLTTQRVSVFGEREQQLNWRDISAIRLATIGLDSDRLVIELMGDQQHVALRLPRRIHTLSAEDQSGLGRLVSENLGVPLLQE
jgi:hypothetical protein